MSRVPAVLVSVLLAASLAACGADSGDDPTVATPTEQSTTEPDEQAPDEQAPAEPTDCQDAPPTTEPGPDATTDLSVKPEPQIPDEDPPCDLQITDVVVGDGEEAVAGAQVAVKYVGALYEDGSEFDSSWSRGDDETLPFEVGAPGLIPGFDQGVTGMREGGRRQVVIPSELGYGPEGRAPIPPGATLVFVIDLVEVTPPQ